MFPQMLLFSPLTRYSFMLRELSYRALLLYSPLLKLLLHQMLLFRPLTRYSFTVPVLSYERCRSTTRS